MAQLSPYYLGIVNRVCDALAPSQAAQFDTAWPELQQSIALASKRALISDWHLWLSNCEATGACFLPADDIAASHFMESGLSEKTTTRKRFLFSLRQLHFLAGEPRPFSSAQGKALRRRQNRTWPNNEVRRKSLRWRDIERIVESLDFALLPELQFAVMLTVCYEALLRPHEIAFVQADNFRSLPDGSGILELDDRKIAGRVAISLSQPTTALVQEWLRRSGIERGPMFRLFSAWRTGFSEVPPNRDYWRKLLRDGCRRVSIELHLTIAIGSIARGAEDDLLEFGASVWDVVRLGRWSEPSRVLANAKRFAGKSNPMQQLISARTVP